MPTYYVDEDYPARPEIQQPLPERNNRRGSESSTLETDVYVWRYALLVVHTTKEEKEDTTQSVPICACMEFQVISLKLESEQHKEIAFFIITWIRN